jgi:hypothetical protein
MVWPQLTRSRRLLLVAAVLWHLSLLISWRVGFYHRLTFDSVATHGRRGWDFYAVYQAGHNALTGVSIYESDNDKIDVAVPLYTPYRYLPFTALTLGVALNALSPLWGYRLWVLIVELALLACAWVSWRLARAPNRGAVLASMWLLFTPHYLELYLGQFSLLQAAWVFAMLLGSAQGLNSRTDAWWALSLLWKQNTALLAPIYLRQRRIVPLLLVGLVVLALSLPYLLATPGALTAFLQNLHGGAPGHQLGNLGVRQWLYSAVSWLLPTVSANGHVWIGRAWVAAVLAASAIATFGPRRVDVGLLICLWMSVYFLIYHDVWEHHYVLALPVCVWLYHRTGSRWVLACYALLAIWTPYILIDPAGLAAWHAPLRWEPLAPRWLDAAYHSCKAVPALALWGWQIIRLWRQRSSCSPGCATI